MEKHSVIANYKELKFFWELVFACDRQNETWTPIMNGGRLPKNFLLNHIWTLSWFSELVITFACNQWSHKRSSDWLTRAFISQEIAQPTNAYKTQAPSNEFANGPGSRDKNNCIYYVLNRKIKAMKISVVSLWFRIDEIHVHIKMIFSNWNSGPYYR